MSTQAVMRAWIFKRFARQEMFIVYTAVVGSDTASVPERWRGQVLHGILSSRENVCCQRSSRSARASSSCPTRSCAAFVGRVVDKARKGFVSARVVVGH